MEEPFGTPHDLGEADVSLCIFPHLPEFVLIDLRGDTPALQVLQVSGVLDESFVRRVESAFSQVLREESPYPFTHLFNLPVRIEEVVREAAMEAILEHVLGDAERVPRVAVLIMAGVALSFTPEQITEAIQHAMGAQADSEFLEECRAVLRRLMHAERALVQQEERQERREVLNEESPRFYTIWAAQG